MNRRLHGRGFTLVEVLVALFVMSILAALAWRGVDALARSREAGEQKMQRSLRFTNVIAQWEADIRALRDTGDVPAVAFDGGTLRLTRTAPGGVQLVAWSLKQGRWLRWASPAVTHGPDLQEWWMRSQQLHGGEAEQLKALEDVVNWNVQFFRVDSWTNAQSTGDLVVAAPPANPTGTPNPVQQQQIALPDGIRLMLTFAEGTLTRDVIVPAQSRSAAQ